MIASVACSGLHERCFDPSDDGLRPTGEEAEPELCGGNPVCWKLVEIQINV